MASEVEIIVASELALKVVKTVDDEGYYDRQAASDAVDRYCLAPVREALDGLRMNPKGCWCVNAPATAVTPEARHSEACQRARAVYESLEVEVEQ